MIKIAYFQQEPSGKLGEIPTQVRCRYSRITDLLLVFCVTEMQDNCPKKAGLIGAYHFQCSEK